MILEGNGICKELALLGHWRHAFDEGMGVNPFSLLLFPFNFIYFYFILLLFLR